MLEVEHGAPPAPTAVRNRWEEPVLGYPVCATARNRPHRGRVGISRGVVCVLPAPSGARLGRWREEPAAALHPSSLPPEAPVGLRF